MTVFPASRPSRYFAIPNPSQGSSSPGPARLPALAPHSAAFVERVGLGAAGVLVDDRHQALHDSTRTGMLVDVAAINHAHGALPHQCGGFVEHVAQILLAAAAHQHRAA